MTDLKCVYTVKLYKPENHVWRMMWEYFSLFGHKYSIDCTSITIKTPWNTYYMTRKDTGVDFSYIRQVRNTFIVNERATEEDFLMTQIKIIPRGQQFELQLKSSSGESTVEIYYEEHYSEEQGKQYFMGIRSDMKGFIMRKPLDEPIEWIKGN